MSVCVTPDVSFVLGSVDVEIPFVIAQADTTGTLVPIPDASTATVTWVSPSGQERPLSLLSPVSAVFAWYTTAREFPTPHVEIGRCRVSFPSGARFWTAPFTIEVRAVF